MTIGEFAFCNCQKLTDLIIESGVLTIGNYAFVSCVSLMEVSVPVSVTALGNGAFSSCCALEMVLLSEGLLSIGDTAFAGTLILSSIVIPASVATVGQQLFYGSYIDLIFCHASEQPDGWNGDWLSGSDNPTVEWGHVYGDWTDNEDGTHIRFCTVAGCTASETASHEIADYWCANVTYHWRECEHCSIETDKGEHTYETEWTTDGTYHWHVCSVCGGRESDKAAHSYDNACDTTCNVCGAERSITHDYETEWTTDETYHWNVCNVCGVVVGEKLVHIYDNDCDTTCNVCKEERSITHDYETEWTTDGTHHWHVCSVCSVIEGDKIAHYGGTATCLQKAICDACQKAYGELAAHNWVDDECTVCHEQRNTEGLTFGLINNDTEYEVTGYTGTATTVRILTTYNGKPVTAIANNAFVSCTTMQKVIIPSSVLTIEASAFEMCSNLETLEIQHGLTTIGDGAFFYCTALKTVILPNSVTTIGDSAFRGCDALEVVIIPSSVTTVGSDAFTGSSETIFHVNWQTDERPDGWKSNWCTDYAQIVVGHDLVYTDNGDGTHTITCSIPGCEYSKTENHNWKSVWVTSDDYHWHECVQCGDVEGSMVEHDYETEWTSDGTHHWHVCSVCGVIEGEKATHTYTNTCDTACNVCGAIRTITHTPEAEPATCERSQLCSVCGEVVVAAHTAHDEYGICTVCDPDATRGFVYILNSNDNTYTLYTIGTASASSIVIPKYYNNLPVTVIKDNVFANKTAITSVAISDKITTIEASAFANCTNLLTVDMGDGVTTLGNGVFSGCSSLHTIYMSDSLTTIGSQTFRSCALTSITIGANVTSIGDGAFASCLSLTTVIIDSEYVAVRLTNTQSCGYLVNSATTVYVKSNITQIGSLLTNVNLYTATTSDMTGYD